MYACQAVYLWLILVSDNLKRHGGQDTWSTIDRCSHVVGPTARYLDAIYVKHVSSSFTFRGGHRSSINTKLLEKFLSEYKSDRLWDIDDDGRQHKGFKGFKHSLELSQPAKFKQYLRERSTDLYEEEKASQCE